MEPSTLFFIILALLTIDFIADKWLDHLNAKRFDAPVPTELKDVYDEEEYKKSQRYKKTNYRFGLLTSSVSFLVTIAFFLLDGFEYADNLARHFSNHEIVIALIFFGVILLASDLISIPFSWYRTFVIEERFGFNRTSPKTFVLDKIKGWLVGALIGGGLLAAIIGFFNWAGPDFWIYAWILATAFTVVMNMFYSKLIVPLFNKQTPLEEGSLRKKIEAYAEKEGFSLDKIFVIDGSKRSTKANAYFSGFGAEKRVTLFDTLINDLEEEEIVAVLAHEVGHYKKNHIIFNLLMSTLLTGLTLFLLSLFITVPELSLAIGVAVPSFHAGLIAFGILYSPISQLTGLMMNYVSRRFEYQADRFAAKTYNSGPMISSLKKLSKNSLTNLTPHPAYVFVHYSHPTLLQRIKNLKA